MGFQIGFPALRNYPPSGVSYDADVQTWIGGRAAASDPVPTAYANAVNQYILDLKAISGHWDTITQLLVFAGATTVAGGLVPIKGATPSHTALVDGDFALKTGVIGNTTTKFIDTGYTNADFGQDNIHGYALVTAAASVSSGLFGYGPGPVNAFRIRWNSAARCNQGSNSTVSSTATGEYGLSRSASANYRRMIAGTVTTITATSATPYVGKMTVLATGTPTTASDFCDARVLVWACGPATTLENYTTPGADLQTALNAI